MGALGKYSDTAADTHTYNRQSGGSAAEHISLKASHLADSRVFEDMLQCRGNHCCHEDAQDADLHVCVFPWRQPGPKTP